MEKIGDNTSGSSESDIEAKIKLNVTKHVKTCFICQTHGGILINLTAKSFTKFRECLTIREHISKSINSNLHEQIECIENQANYQSVFWHKQCYASVTSKRNIDNFRKKYVCHKPAEQQITENTSNDSTDISLKLRQTSFDPDKCLFCQKRSDKKVLSQVMTTNVEQKIRRIAKHNALINKRIGWQDLIAIEGKYHANCFTTEFKKIKSMQLSDSIPIKNAKPDVALNNIYAILQKSFDNNRVLDMSSIYQKYLELGGCKSKRQLNRNIHAKFSDKVEFITSKQKSKSQLIIPINIRDETIHALADEEANYSYTPILPQTSDFSEIFTICSGIRNEIEKIPIFKTFNNLNIHDYKKYIPESLFLIINLLISTGNDTDELNTLNICQDIIYCFSKKYTPKHIGLGIMVHQETRSRKIIDIIHGSGHCISYADILRIRNTIAQEEVARYLQNDNIVVPRQLQMNTFLQFAADNIDILEETLDKSPTFHGTQMVAFQNALLSDEGAREYNILPYKTKLDVPDNFHLLRSINITNDVKPIPKIKNKNRVSARELTNSNYISKHNIAWILCRLSNTEELIIPQWSGFNKLLFPNEQQTTTYGYLPLLPHVISDYDTVWTTIKRFESIANTLNNQFTVITFDEAVYFKAKKIQWLKYPELDNVIIRLGGFHVMMNFIKVIGQHMEHSGLKDIWVESGLYSDVTATALFAGKKWNKSVRAHKLTYEALLRLLIPLFEKWLVDCNSEYIHSINFARLLSSQVGNDILANKSLTKFNSIVETLENISDIFLEFINAQSMTIKFWFTYINLVEILLEFLYSERSSNWELHLKSFRRMLPWFFTYDHTNYARWGTVYLLDMLSLPLQIEEEFKKGNFVVRRLPGQFNSISVDLALEHVNKRSKVAGGIVGLTKNNTRLDEWFLSYNIIGLMIDRFKCSFNTKEIMRESQNIEIGARRMNIDEESVIKLQEQFYRFKICDREESQLFCLSTNEIIDESRSQAMLNACEIGEEALKKFVNIVETDEFYKPLKKINLQKLSTKKKLTSKIKEFTGGQKLLQQILAAKEWGRTLTQTSIFDYELTSYPMSLFTNGILATPSNKSNLGNIIEQLTKSLKLLPHSDKKTCHIFDGMSIVQAIGKPNKAITFTEYGKIFNSIIFKNRFSAQRIDLVFDHYLDTSIKNCTRSKRLSGSPINIKIDGGDTSLPQQWHLFIHSIFNKRQLTHFLSDISYEYSKTSKVEYATSGGFNNILDYKTNFSEDDHFLCSTHEEADTRILLHILSAKNSGYSRCIVESRDTDVLILLTHFKDQLTPELWMKVGTKENVRFISIHDIEIEFALRENLLTFHALTGCDTTSQFSGIGKTSSWKVFVNYPKLLDDISRQPFSDDVFQKMHKFVLKLYSNNPDIASVNHLRSILAVSKTIDKLPPTENSLRQHCLRAYYQMFIWANSLKPQPLLPNIFDHGWMSSSTSEIIPIYQTQPTVPDNPTILSACRCKKGCGNKSCSCQKQNICCIGSCFCMAQKSCTNKLNKTHIAPVIDDDEDTESD